MHECKPIKVHIPAGESYLRIGVPRHMKRKRTSVVFLM
jgi:hypothetical protein